MTAKTVRLIAASTVAAALASSSPAHAVPRAYAAALPELKSMTLHLPRVPFNYQLIAGESFRVSFAINRPAPAGGTLIEMRRFRDSGPIHTLPQRVRVVAGRTTAELVVGSVPVDPATETATHQQVSAHTTDGDLPGNVTLFDSLFVVARPAGDPRGNAITQEAEDAVLTGTQVIRDDSPYNLASGNAFVRYPASTGSAAFTFIANRTAEHWVILRYANDGFSTSGVAVTINGVRRTVTVGTGAGLGWYRLDGFGGVTLNAGANTIVVSPASGSNPVDLDWVQIAVA